MKEGIIMNMNETIQFADQALMHTYNRFPVVFERGEGVYLYDMEGKKYLDFGAGIAVFAFGYGDKEYNDALKEQIDKIIHTSNLYYNVPAAEAANGIVKISGMDRVFFTNSGTEAIEGAIKLARKYAYLKDGSTDHEIIAMNHSFHGRSLGALSVTGQPKYQEAFRPLMGGVVFADFNNLEDVLAKITDKTCGILLEPIQGEGGIYPASKEFMQGIKKVCEEKDILLIFDEIQCGMGRTGKMFACEHYGIKPDILTMAKALGCGIPVGAFGATKEVAAAMVPGDHGTTYGGNPLACAAVNKVLELFQSRNVLENVSEVGEYLEQKLEELSLEYDFVKEHRGMGLIQGLELSRPVGEYVVKALEKGLVLISAGANVIRFVPPLIVKKEHVDEMIEILKEVFSE
jgi:acetylornithine/N-succinyldiaminopimelate aminotransferase